MIQDSLWKQVLHLKEKVYGFKGNIDNILLTESAVHINPKHPNASKDVIIQLGNRAISLGWDCCVLHVEDNGHVNIVREGYVDKQYLHELQLYLPFCIAPVLAKGTQKSLSISHFAQTLDGFIATVDKHSQWIGNQENLVHAHRLRALVDAVIIGNKTLHDDQPRLTVRHVAGHDPVKVVIGNSDHPLGSLLENENSRLIRFSSVERTASSEKRVMDVCLTREGRTISSSSILSELYKRDVYSVLIEGGSYTSSIFQTENNIDMVQLHISPMVFGSGVKAFNLHSIQKVDECCTFDHHLYHPVGNAIMFTGFTKK